MMHYEANVRTVVVGGRPSTGPMQVHAGTRGARDYEADLIDLDIDFVGVINDTTTKYLPSRYLEWSLHTANFNLQDQIRSDSDFPLQFAYEAADCRIFWTLDTFNNFTALWKYAVDAISNPAMCVQDSTNQPSTGHLTDTVGPTETEKLAWAAVGSQTTIVPTAEETSIDLAFLVGENRPDEDIVGQKNTLCRPNDWNPCANGLTCVQGPYCYPSGAFSNSLYFCQRTCGTQTCNPQDGPCPKPVVCASGEQCYESDSCSFNNSPDINPCTYCAPIQTIQKTCASSTSDLNPSGQKIYKGSNPGGVDTQSHVELGSGTRTEEVSDNQGQNKLRSMGQIINDGFS